MLRTDSLRQAGAGSPLPFVRWPSRENALGLGRSLRGHVAFLFLGTSFAFYPTVTLTNAKVTV